jgi:hypothetical protein
MTTTATSIAHPARVALSAVDIDIADLAATNLWSMSETELLELRIEAEQTLARLQSTVLAITREVDARGAAVATGAASTAAWLRGRLRQHPADARAEVRLARDLDQDLPATASALSAGDISLARAQAVATGIRRLPRATDPVTRRLAEAHLAEQAREFDPAALHRLSAHLVQVLDPERGAALEKEEAAQADRQELTLSHGADGACTLRGHFGPVHGGFIDTVLAAVSAPRPRADGAPDQRPAARRRAEGLVELLKAALTDEDVPEAGGEPVAMTVTTSAEYLRQAVSRGDDSASNRCCPSDHSPVAAATLEDGTPLSPETTRRLGCDAWLVTAVLDSLGAVLDIGRSSRVVPRPMRRALVLRDRGCAFPGCGRPPRWCHAHHIWHWALGGPTKIDNLVLLCGYHHRLVHHGGWEVDIGPDRHPRFTPPAWIDPRQIPRPCWRPPDEIQLSP